MKISLRFKAAWNRAYVLKKTLSSVWCTQHFRVNWDNWDTGVAGTHFTRSAQTLYEVGTYQCNKYCQIISFFFHWLEITFIIFIWFLQIQEYALSTFLIRRWRLATFIHLHKKDIAASASSNYHHKFTFFETTNFISFE